MFELFKKKKPIEITNETEYSFIWYKKMVNGNKTHYTQPFRTKVKAKTWEEAKEKVANFALQKMTLVIVDESKFTQSEISFVQQQYEKITEQFEKILNTFK